VKISDDAKLVNGIFVFAVIATLVAAVVFVKISHETVHAIGSVVNVLAFLGFVIGAYFLPTFVALGRHHRNSAAIALLNLFLGWTLLGWVVALVWAAINERRER
jgi:T4 superinfection immunity protein